MTDEDKPKTKEGVPYRRLRWDADMARLFEWYHTCPKPWNPHWYESEVGGVTLHITRPSRKDNGDT